jgi:hypothetical protein
VNADEDKQIYNLVESENNENSLSGKKESDTP